MFRYNKIVDWKSEVQVLFTMQILLLNYVKTWKQISNSEPIRTDFWKKQNVSLMKWTVFNMVYDKKM